MIGNRLYKYEKLCSLTAIQKLFSDSGNSIYAYPLRAIYRFVPPSDNHVGSKFFISIPKRKMHHAVDRVLLRRRVREAYRLNRSILLQELNNRGISTEIAFIYIADDKKNYQTLELKMQEILAKISKACLEYEGD